MQQTIKFSIPLFVSSVVKLFKYNYQFIFVLLKTSKYNNAVPLSEEPNIKSFIWTTLVTSIFNCTKEQYSCTISLQFCKIDATFFKNYLRSPLVVCTSRFFCRLAWIATVGQRPRFLPKFVSWKLKNNFWLKFFLLFLFQKILNLLLLLYSKKDSILVWSSLKQDFRPYEQTKLSIETILTRIPEQ